jgi:isopentenyldiphosphate isomerase
VSSESVDVVDEFDRVVRTVARSEMRRDRLRHRAVFVAVLDGAGRLLVHRRAPTKDVWPGWLDLAVGGVVTSGETYLEAARRELAEEIGVVGVDPDVIDGGIFQLYDDADVSLVGRCFAVTTTGPFEFADGEVSDAWWVSRDEFEQWRDRERFLPDSIALLLPLVRPLLDW